MEKRTKIVCTIGPASESVSTLTDMVRGGMNVARLNFSHGSYEHHSMLINNIRRVSKELDRPVAFLQDLQGPKLRLGRVGIPSEGLEIKKGQEIVLMPERDVARMRKKAADSVIVPVQFEKLFLYAKDAGTIFIDDATIQLRVRSIRGKTIRATVQVAGTLIAHKGINLPEVDVEIPTITAKDTKDLLFGLKNDMDYVALSFVKKGGDVEKLRRLMSRHKKGRLLPAVIAKIENQQALEHFDDILSAADGIMIARGDLGIQTPPANVPVVQKDLVRTCLQVAKPVIVATQMLDSMIRNPLPTRAEVNDVANAVIDHADAVMLSGETAFGKYPIAAVRMMRDAILQAENSPYDDFVELFSDQKDSPEAMLAASAVQLAGTRARAVVVAVDALDVVHYLSRLRSERHELIVLAGNDKVYRQLALLWGIIPVLCPKYVSDDTMRPKIVSLLRKKRLIRKGESIVLIIGDRPGSSDAIQLVKV